MAPACSEVGGACPFLMGCVVSVRVGGGFRRSAAWAIVRLLKYSEDGVECSLIEPDIIELSVVVCISSPCDV